jgi:hypothetical protein
MKIIAIAALFAGMVSVSLPVPALAQADCNFANFQDSFKCVIGLQKKSGVIDQEPRSLVLTILRYGLQLVAVLAVIAIVVSGVLYLISAGDEKKAETAKKALVYAIIGLVLIGAALMIVNLLIRALRGEAG